MMSSIENVVIETADSREHLTPPITRCELHGFNIEMTVVGEMCYHRATSPKPFALSRQRDALGFFHFRFLPRFRPR